MAEKFPIEDYFRKKPKKSQNEKKDNSFNDSRSNILSIWTYTAQMNSTPKNNYNERPTFKSTDKMLDESSEDSGHFGSNWDSNNSTDSSWRVSFGDQ